MVRPKSRHYNKEKLRVLFESNPGYNYSTREIRAVTGMALSTIRGLLLELEDEGFIICDPEDHRPKHCRLNK